MSSSPSSQSSELLLSLGVISVDSDKFAQRRTEQRSTWLGVGHRDPRVLARFVMRCGTWRMSKAYAESHYSPSEAMREENGTFGDLVCTDVPENAGRLKGPSLVALAWFEHALSRPRPRSRFIAVIDDDAYIHLAPHGLLDIIQAFPLSSHTYRDHIAEATSPLQYFGAIHGWSINHTSFHFGAFGWSGWRGCAECGPFPFATGSFIGMSHALALRVLDATRAEEVPMLHALPPTHQMFYHDPFIGQAIYRLVQPGRGSTPKIDVYNLDPWALDHDGFNVGRRLLLWHNRRKYPCRVACLGELYLDQDRHCGTGAIGDDFSWTQYRQGAVDSSRYTMWRPHFINVNVEPATTYSREPSQPSGWPVRGLAGEDARANATCQSLIDMRNPATVAALNLTRCATCMNMNLTRIKVQMRPRALALPVRVGHLGYCETTTYNSGDCAVDSKGSFRWPIGDRHAWPDLSDYEREIAGMQDCMLQCLQCARCDLVSFSRTERDCSWYSNCDLDKLLHTFATGHHSQRVRLHGNITAEANSFMAVPVRSQ